MSDVVESGREAFAIIGLGCRFPGAASPAEFWRLLAAGEDAISDIPLDRFDAASLYDPRPSVPGRIASQRGGFLPGIDRFDAAFFGMSPREAERLDPQQRLLLELAWEAFEDAGLLKEQLAGSATGVFVGMWLSDYEARLFADPSRVDFHMTTGSGRYTASGRLSHVFGLHGPSLTLDTACSSSLVAVHLACQSLHSGETTLALAAGVNVILQPHITIAYSQSRMMAPDGRCKFGDAAADGYVRSEGAGVVVLKRLGQALADGDPIRAVILGSAVNNDGGSGGSLGTPGRAGQEDLLRRAYRAAGIAPSDVDYVEVHGTGTVAGDPVELQALATVLGEDRPADRPLLVGSVKTNIGHTEGAAGMAGLIKTVLAFEHAEIPASLHLDNPNPSLPWDRLPLLVQRTLGPWPRTGRPARAGVSSFGIAGTNAHIVLEAVAKPGASDPSISEREAGGYLLLLSARADGALSELAAAYRDRLREPGGAARIGDICYTAAVRRDHHGKRLAVLGRDAVEIAHRLDEYVQGRNTAAVISGLLREDRPPRVAFVFPGQGSQWVGMGRQLLRAEPVFRDALVGCDAAVATVVGWSVLAELEATGSQRSERIEVVQPVLFAVQVALAALWRSWGVEPAAVIGHSMGEVAAAHVAGALDLDDAARIIGERSRLLQTVSGRGGMALVELSVDEARAALRGRDDRLSIAVSNSTRSTVIAGDNAALTEVLAALKGRGVFCRRVKVDVASHSPQVDPLLGDLTVALGGTTGHVTSMAIYSTVTGEPIEGKDLDTAYWVRNLRAPVQFAAAIRRLVADGYNAFVEISPHPLLVPAIQEETGTSGRSIVAVGSLRRESDERAALLDTLGRLYAHGVPVRWTALYPAPRRGVPLPAYPWQRDRFWYEPDGQRTSPPRRRAHPKAHPLLGDHFTSSLDQTTHFWEVEVGADPSWLGEHRVDGVAMLPAAAIVELVLSAAAAELGAGPWMVEHASFVTAIALVAAVSRTLQLVIRAAEPGSFDFRVSSQGQRKDSEQLDWTLHAEGAIRLAAGEAFDRPAVAEPDSGPAAVEETGRDHYVAMKRRRLEYGPAFQGIQELRRGVRHVAARLALTETVQRESSRALIHPCLLDAALQCLVAALPTTGSDPLTRSPYVPVAMGALRIARALGREPWQCDARVRELTDDGATAVGDVVVIDADGTVIVDARDLRLVALARAGERGVESLLYEIEWVVRLRTAAASEHGKASGAWLVLSDRRGVGQALADALRAAGDSVVTVHASSQEDVGRPELYEPILRDLETRHGGCRGVVHAWVLDVPAPETAGDDALRQAQVHGCGSVVALVQALVRHGFSTPPALWLLTAGAQYVPGQVGGVAVQQSPLWGLGASIRSEHPELMCRNVDLGPSPTSEELQALTSDCRDPDREDQLAIRGSTRFVARLTRRPEAPLEAPSGLRAGEGPFRAEVGSPGMLDSLVLRRARRLTPAPGEVEIEVLAVGLNFMNVMSALGICPGYPRGVGPLGIECSGRVVAVGEGVNGLETGHEVVAVAFDCLGTHAVADARLVARKPRGLSHEVAASLPIAFITARYALEHLARLRRGERVLIHAAAGGVGLAAVQLAHRAGARVVATAGSEEKRAYLAGLGVDGVFDSRSLAFATEIMRATDGAGVDVVLNSLAGDAIAASLSTLSAYGRFVEIGKRDIYENARLGLAPFRKNLSYFAVDLDRMARERPGVVGALLAEVLAQVEARELEPLPVRVFPVTELADAFRHMAQARHTGKIVISLAPEVTRTVALAPGPASVRADGSYVITGGLGALGLRVATWLVDEGARHLVLLGRRPPSTPALAAIGELRARGARVVTAAVDVADATQLAAALDEARRTGPPLRGVVHAAGSLDDSTLLQLDAERWASVWAPKVAGAWNLHRLTASDPLEFFVLFSSVSAFLGLAGQANYAAANAFLDALARARQVAGQVGLSVGWGPWSEIGLAAADARRGERLAHRGLDSVAPVQGIAALAHLLGSRQGHVGVMRLDPDAWYAETSPPFAEQLLTGGGSAAIAGGERPASSVRASVQGASWQAARAVLDDYLIVQLARVLKLDRAQVDIHAPLKALGLDSLMALELRHRLESDLGLALSATLVWNYPTLRAIAEFLATTLGVRRDDPAPAQSAKTAIVDDGGEQTTADVEAMMAAELAHVERLLQSDRVQP